MLIEDEDLVYEVVDVKVQSPFWTTAEQLLGHAVFDSLCVVFQVKNYRKDGYTWKKRRSGNTIREDHTRLKVDGIEVKYGS